MRLVANMDAFMAKLRGECEEVKRMFTVTLKHTIILLHEEITARTPVNTGKTLANYIWSVGDPVVTTVTHSMSGSSLGTNAMPLGPEPRRAQNQQIADATLHSLDFSNPFQRFWLTNTGEAIYGLEYGILPLGPEFTPRSPQGMFAISLQYVHGLLEAGAI